MTLTLIGFMILKLLCAAFGILLVARLALAFKGRGPHGALAELDRRFARGEIGAEEYRERRAVLES